MKEQNSNIEGQVYREARLAAFRAKQSKELRRFEIALNATTPEEVAAMSIHLPDMAQVLIWKTEKGI